MICHGELARLKPPIHRLTSFYLTIAIGGVVGGVFVAIIAPIVFNSYWEFHIGLLGTGFLAWLCVHRETTKELLGTRNKKKGRSAKGQ